MAKDIVFKLPKTKSKAQIEKDMKALLTTEAKTYQNEVTTYIRDNIGFSSKLNGNPTRSEESTGRLARVTNNASNRFVGKTIWRVGIPSYLDRSSAKYWRLIDQGSRGLYDHGRGFEGTVLKMRPAGFTGGRDFRSYPGGRRYDAETNLGPYKFDSNGQPVQFRILVKHEIEGMNAYHTVFVNNGWREKLNKDFQLFVRKSFLG